ncbi:MAG TPA: helix-turn-helix transcriptional regulator [Erysipelothrix sp.]|jgi:DNA-binding HxlR family transcriptional regulator|nr:helix-turn-helix transcriptional regulator [Erysipelothrix sp.]
MKKEACPYITSAFELLSRKWFGIILHTISLNPQKEAHFSDLKSGITNITPRILSMRLLELQEEGLIEKFDSDLHHVYRLTEKGCELVNSLKGIEDWAHKYL